MALIVEVLDPRTGEVRARRRLEAGGATVGRGYGNDIVLDDAWADVEHARIAPDEEGTLAIVDLGSVNGLRTPDGTRHARLPVRPDLEVRLGRTRLRFRDTDASLPPARRDTAAWPTTVAPPRWWGAWWAQLGPTAVAALLVAWITWLGNFGASPASEVVSTVLGLLVLAMLWAGVWAVAGRVVVQRFRFLGHLALISALVAAAMIYLVVNGWAEYFFPDHAWPVALGAVAWFVLLAGLVAAHLRLASPLSRRRRWTAGLVASAALFAIGAVVTLAESESFSDVPSFPGTLKPFASRLLPTVPVEQFRRVTGQLVEEVNALAAAADR